MADYSPGVVLVWQLGAMEAKAARYDTIEREHIMIGLCKLPEMTEAPEMESVAVDFANPRVLKEEGAALADCFHPLRVDAMKLRRKLRQLMGQRSDNPQGDTREMHRSDSCRKSFERATMFAVEQSSRTLNSVHLLAAVLDNPGPRIAQAVQYSGVDVQTWRHNVIELMKSGLVVTTANDADQRPSASSFLAQFGTDLTKLAEQKKLEPLIGRKPEQLQILRTLTRKTKNNPLLLGDPGVGKTALVRGLAQRIADKSVVEDLQNSRLIELNMASLVAGTRHRGDFEERVVRLVEELKSRQDVILFIDEIHTMVGAGSASGSLDAANILKPALASGEIRCIGSTTYAEYRKHFEKDAALARRFQPIVLEEPSAEDTLAILEGLKERYETHHTVKIEPEALKAAVALSRAHLPERRLPDKALDLLDEACTRLKVATTTYRPGLKVVHQVTAETIAQVLTEWTGIPAGKLTTGRQLVLKTLEQELAKRVFGQNDAITRVSGTIRMSYAGLRDPNRPAGVFLFVGPTGVGKTELCRALSSVLFGSEKDMIRFDMSEFMEPHSISKLIGSPPGYIGHDEEGQLTGKLRRKPHSIVLLDEIEKAHPVIFDIFLQLFDEGRITDAQGNTVDGKNAIYVLTSNVGSGKKGPSRALGFLAEPVPEEEAMVAEIQDELRKVFRPEFLNRLDEIVVFKALSVETIREIANKLLSQLGERLAAQDIEFVVEPDVLLHLAEKGFDPFNGARPMVRAVERMISNPISQRLVSGDLPAGSSIHGEMRNGKIHFSITQGAADDPPATA